MLILANSGGVTGAVYAINSTVLEATEAHMRQWRIVSNHRLQEFQNNLLSKVMWATDDFSAASDPMTWQQGLLYDDAKASSEPPPGRAHHALHLAAPPLDLSTRGCKRVKLATALAS